MRINNPPVWNRSSRPLWLRATYFRVPKLRTHRNCGREKRAYDLMRLPDFHFGWRPAMSALGQKQTCATHKHRCPLSAKSGQVEHSCRCTVCADGGLIFDRTTACGKRHAKVSAMLGRRGFTRRKRRRCFHLAKEVRVVDDRRCTKLVIYPPPL